MPPRNRPPAHLADPVRDHAAVVAACHDRDLGRLFRTINNLTDYPEKFTASHIARRCEMTPSQVGDYMSDQRCASSLDVFNRVADGLRIPGAYFGLTPRPWEKPTPRPAAATRFIDAESPAEATASSHEFQPWKLIDTMTRSNISTAAVEQLRRAVFASAARYPSTPPQDLLPVMLGQLNRMQAALDKTRSLRILRECVQLTGMLAGFTGNLYLDLGDPAQADAYFDIGEAAGHEAEDGGLTAWVLTTRSIGPYYSGDFDAAATILERASSLIAQTDNRRRAAWIYAMAARAHAAQGSRSRALTSLDESAGHLAAAEAPHGIDFFDEARFRGIAGSCHLRLRDAPESEAMLHTAISSRASTDAKGRALLIFDLAECRIVQGEIEEASELATTALELASNAVVRPIADRARVLHNELRPWHQLGSVAGYAERVRELTAIIPEQKG